MKVEITKLTGALSKVKSLIGDTKQVPGVLFRVKENKLEVCYSNGRNAIINIIEATNTDNDYFGDVVVNYNRLVDIINGCQSSGKVFVREVELNFSEGNVLVIEAKKMIERVNADGECEEKVISNFKQSIPWNKPEESLKFGILTRVDYDDIFEEGDTYDVYDRKELINILSKTSLEKSRNVYVSNSRSCAFVVNLAYTLNIPINQNTQVNLSIPTTIAKYLVEILNKTTDDIYVSLVNNRFCKISTADKTTGVWFEISSPSRTDIDALDIFKAKKYDTYQINFVREALHNVIKSAMDSSKSEKNVFRFSDSKYEEGLKDLNIHSMNSGASISNTFDVVCDKCVDNSNSIDSLELPVNLKVLDTILTV